MINYLNKNVNPKNKKTCDCTIRALTTATGKDYWEVFEELCDLTRKTGYMFNEKRVEDKFLEQNGFVKMKQPRKPDGKKYQVAELDKICKDDVVVITVANHMTVVVKGTLIDIWDCRRKTINNYYVKR